MIQYSVLNSFIFSASTYSYPVDLCKPFFYMYQSCHDEEDDDGEEEVKSFEVR